MCEVRSLSVIDTMLSDCVELNTIILGDRDPDTFPYW